MKAHLIGPTFLGVALLSMGAYAQDTTYFPVAVDNPAPGRPSSALRVAEVSITRMPGEFDTLAADIVRPPSTASTSAAAAAAVPVCATPPSLEEVQGSLSYHQTLLSSAVAARLGIPLVGVSVSDNQMILVRDWTRAAECTATDNTTRLLYGQAIRTVIAIGTLDARADLSLAAIAANATINRKNSQISVDALGLASPKISDAVASIARMELNVESYGDFTRIESDLIKLADASDTTRSVRRLGVVADVQQTTLRDSITTAFALYQVKDNKSCVAAKGNYPAGAATIEAVYRNFTGACSATLPQASEKLRAEQLLDGMRVTR